MRTVDLFAGCGGMSKGFQNVGFHLVAAFEYWETAAKCYAQNFQHPVFTTDLSDTASAIEKIKSFQPNLIIGGPPCQDFSHAGKRIESTRASLTKSYAEIIRAVRPQYFVMENVDRARNSHAFQEARAIFESLGYGLTQIVLDASRCGAPQKRKRFFCIGGLGESTNFLKARLMGKLADKDMTLRDYFGTTLDFSFYYRHPRNYSRRAVFSIDEPAPTMRGVNRPIPKGYPGHPNDACPVTENVRCLTTLERALIQTFPADYHWTGNKTDMEQMIGNAVPVKLAEYVASALMEHVKSKSSYEIADMQMELLFADGGFQKNFQTWLIEDKNLSERTARDMVSRVRRADSIYPMNRESGIEYLYRIQGTSAYHDLAPSVRSQLKRAVSLYCDYMKSNRYENSINQHQFIVK